MKSLFNIAQEIEVIRERCNKASFRLVGLLFDNTIVILK